MSFKRMTVVLGGGGAAGLVKLSGAFDGTGKVKGECGAGSAKRGDILYIFGDNVAKVVLDGAKTAFEVRLSAKGDIDCALVTSGGVLTGGTGERVDRRRIEGRVRALAADAAPKTEQPEREDPVPSPQGRETVAEKPEERAARKEEPAAERVRTEGGSGGRGASSVLEEGVVYDGTNFYLAVKPQLDEMFVRYPAEERLNAIVPNSRWVRVDADEGDYYVVGVLYDLSTPIFICYGIPGVPGAPPPREIADVCVWLPLSRERQEEGGFWVIYQSAENGKCVR